MIQASRRKYLLRSANKDRDVVPRYPRLMGICAGYRLSLCDVEVGAHHGPSRGINFSSANDPNPNHSDFFVFFCHESDASIVFFGFFVYMSTCLGMPFLRYNPRFRRPATCLPKLTLHSARRLVEKHKRTESAYRSRPRFQSCARLWPYTSALSALVLLSTGWCRTTHPHWHNPDSPGPENDSSSNI